MAKAPGGTQDIRQALTKAPTIQTLWVTRFTIGLGIVLCALISLVGTSWDIQWHLFVGRDRTLIPPHLMMLTGITLGGLLALTAVCVETMVVRRKPQLAQYSTQFAGMFYSSLGTYIAGFAALDAAIAFPLDSYWHSLYGIDVALWTPFHVMILMGMGSMPLGATFMLRSAGQLSRIARQKHGEQASMLFTCCWAPILEPCQVGKQAKICGKEMPATRPAETIRAPGALTVGTISYMGRIPEREEKISAS